jgi:hypothetical protein
MTKVKELGIEQGVQITRPWNPEMYQHNDRVASEMHRAIKSALDAAFESEDDQTVATIAKAIRGYGFGIGYELEDIYEDAVKGLDLMPNHWLNEFCWDELLEAGIVEPIGISFVGYKK